MPGTAFGWDPLAIERKVALLEVSDERLGRERLASGLFAQSEKVVTRAVAVHVFAQPAQ